MHAPGIALVVIGIELDARQRTAPSNRTIDQSSGPAAPFPAVAHVRRSPGENEVLPVPWCMSLHETTNLRVPSRQVDLA
jgi:hypothetical protein